MGRWLAMLVATLMLVGALSGVGAYQLVWPALDRSEKRWQEIAWTFPRDGWPAGRAFRCDSCGEGVELYARPTARSMWPSALRCRIAAISWLPWRRAG